MPFINKDHLVAQLRVLIAEDNKYFAENPADLEKINDGNYSEFVGQMAANVGTENDLMHMAIGIAGEAGELIDAIKKNWAYGKQLDVQNVIEELGDLEWYMAGLRLLIGVTRADVLLQNRQKLDLRYAGSFSNEAAIARADKVEPKLQIIDMSQEQVKAVDETAGLEPLNPLDHEQSK